MFFMSNQKKRIVITLIISILIISLLTLVSANFWDDIKKTITGKDIADVSVTVAGEVPPPEIVYISDITDLNRNLLDGGVTTPKTFEFYVYAPGGIDSLPDGTELTSPDQAYVILVYTGSYPQPNEENQRQSTATCTHSGDELDYDTDNDDVDPNIGRVDVRKYQCTVNMQYYDNYGTETTDENWDVKAYIKDDQNHEEGYDGTQEIVNSHNLPIRTTYFSVLEDFELDPVLIDYGSVGYSDDLNMLPSTIPTITNYGNIDIDKTFVTTYDIPKTDDNTKFVYANWFYTDPSTPCETTRNLPEGQSDIDTSLPQIAFGPTENEDLNICLDKVIFSETTPTGDYSTQAGGQPWMVTTSYCTNKGCT